MPYVSKTFKAGKAAAVGRDLVLSEDLLDLLADLIASRVAAQLRERAPARPPGLVITGVPSAPTLRPDSLYRVAVVMQRLGVSRSTVYRLAHTGALELVKVGARSSGVTGKSLIALIERNQAPLQQR